MRQPYLGSRKVQEPELPIARAISKLRGIFGEEITRDDLSTLNEFIAMRRYKGFAELWQRIARQIERNGKFDLPDHIDIAAAAKLEKDLS
jgi:hypothetical protein